jgi:hypothetical protein
MMPEYKDQLPESQLGRAEWLAEELALCGHEEINAIDILGAACRRVLEAIGRVYAVDQKALDELLSPEDRLVLEYGGPIRLPD